MSSKRPRQASKPYERLNPTTGPSITKEKVSVLAQFLASAVAWNTSEQLTRPLEKLSQEITSMTDEISELILAAEFSALNMSFPPLSTPGPLPTLGSRNLSTPSMLSSMSVSTFVTPSGTRLMMSNVNPDAMDTGFSVSNSSLVMMVPSTDITALKKRVEDLLCLNNTILLEGTPSLSRIRVFNHQVQEHLELIAPVVLRLIKISKVICCVTDYSGVGWTLGLGLTKATDGWTTSSAAWLVQEVVLDIFSSYCRKALEAVRADASVGRTVGRIEVCSIEILKGIAFSAESAMIQERINVHTFVRKYFASQMHGSQLWFSARVNNENDIDASNIPSLHASSYTPLPPSTPSFGDLRKGCAEGRAAIMDLIEHPLGIGFPTQDGLLGTNGILGPINSVITMMAVEFYYGPQGIVQQLCILETRYPGITTRGRLSGLGCTFIDHFPLSAFCHLLVFVLFVFQETPFLLDTFLQNSNMPSPSDIFIPDLNTLVRIMNNVKRMDVGENRKVYLDLYSALSPFSAHILRPINLHAIAECARIFAMLPLPSQG